MSLSSNNVSRVLSPSDGVNSVVHWITWESVGAGLRWIYLDPVFVRLRPCGSKFDLSDLQLSSSAMVAALVCWSFGGFSTTTSRPSTSERSLYAESWSCTSADRNSQEVGSSAASLTGTSARITGAEQVPAVH